MGFFVQLVHRSHGKQFSIMDNPDPVANFLGDGKGMRRQENSGPVLDRLVQEVFDLACALGVEPPPSVRRSRSLLVRAEAPTRSPAFAAFRGNSFPPIRSPTVSGKTGSAGIPVSVVPGPR